MSTPKKQASDGKRKEFVVRLPADTVAWLDLEGAKRNRSRNWLIQEAVEQRMRRIVANRKLKTRPSSVRKER